MSVQVVLSVETCGVPRVNPAPEIANVNRLSLDIPLTAILAPTPGIVSGVSFRRIFPAPDCVTATSRLVAPPAATVFVEERAARPVCTLPAVVKVSLPVPLVLLSVFHAAFAISLQVLPPARKQGGNQFKFV
jgi:hypothetical protein